MAGFSVWQISERWQTFQEESQSPELWQSLQTEAHTLVGRLTALGTSTAFLRYLPLAQGIGGLLGCSALGLVGSAFLGAAVQAGYRLGKNETFYWATFYRDSLFSVQHAGMLWMGALLNRGVSQLALKPMAQWLLYSASGMGMDAFGYAGSSQDTAVFDWRWSFGSQLVFQKLWGVAETHLLRTPTLARLGLAYLGDTATAAFECGVRQFVNTDGSLANFFTETLNNLATGGVVRAVNCRYQNYPSRHFLQTLKEKLPASEYFSAADKQTIVSLIAQTRRGMIPATVVQDRIWLGLARDYATRHGTYLSTAEDGSIRMKYPVPNGYRAPSTILPRFIQRFQDTANSHAGSQMVNIITRNSNDFDIIIPALSKMEQWLRIASAGHMVSWDIQNGVIPRDAVHLAHTRRAHPVALPVQETYLEDFSATVHPFLFALHDVDHAVRITMLSNDVVRDINTMYKELRPIAVSPSLKPVKEALLSGLANVDVTSNPTTPTGIWSPIFSKATRAAHIIKKRKGASERVECQKFIDRYSALLEHTIHTREPFEKLSALKQIMLPN